MRDLIRRRVQQESGAVLVLFALVIIVLFGFTILAVDAAHAFVERRNSQSAADVAAVGAAVQAIQNDGTDDQIADEIIAEAQRLVQINIGTTAWASCSDPDALPYTWAANRGGPTNCVSWSEGFRRVRVRVPTRNINTFFASIIGIDTVAVAAAAEVEGLAQGLGGVLPFGVLTNAGDGSLICLKTQNGGPRVPAACDPSTTGNFGYLDFKTFGGVIPGAGTQCGMGDNRGRLAENIAHGIDHELGTGPYEETDSTAIIDEDKCWNPLLGGGLPVNGTNALTGTSFNKPIFDGFIGGTPATATSAAFPGRLTVTGGATYSWAGYAADDVPLWDYLIPTKKQDCETGISADTAQSPPRWGDIDGMVDTEDEMISCIRWHYYNVGTTTPIFDGLRDSPRFGSVPILHKNWPTGTSEDRTFRSFQTIYVNVLFGGNCPSDGPCGTWFEPGVSHLNDTAMSFTGATAFAIPDGLLTTEDFEALTSLPEIEEYLIVE